MAHQKKKKRMIKMTILKQENLIKNKIWSVIKWRDNLLILLKITRQPID